MEFWVGISREFVSSGLTNEDIHVLGNTTHDLANNDQAASGQSNPAASEHI